jgi:hypothetical protein
MTRFNDGRSCLMAVSDGSGSSHTDVVRLNF